MSPKRFFLKYLLMIILFGNGMTACGLKNETAPTLPAATQTMPPLLQLVSPQPIIVPGRVILVTSGEGDTQRIQNIETLIKELAGPMMTVNTVQNLVAGEITPEVKIIITLKPLGNLPELIGSAPQVQFVSFSPVDLGAAPNLSVIRQQPEKQAFAAGYLSVVIAADWRVNGFLPAEEPLATIVRDAFVNGAEYFCGLCNSRSAPIINFPLTQQISASIDPSGWMPIVEGLRPNVIQVVYIASQSSNAELLKLLAGQSYILVGEQSPPEEVRDRWAATIGEDDLSPLKAIWPAIISGQNNTMVSTTLEIGRAHV